MFHQPGVGEVLASPGEPLDGALRADLEPRFGHDFGDVRVHADAQAATSAAALDARAYTVGRHIVLSNRAPALASPEGRHLLAHELAHVVQQSRGGPAPELDPSAAHERDADAAALAALAGSARVPVAQATGIGPARIPLLDDWMDLQAKVRAKMTSFVASGVGQMAHWVGLGPRPDWAGRAILERYMTGGGDWHIRGDRRWKDYMFACAPLQEQVRQELVWEVLPKLRGGPGTYLFHKRFQAHTGQSSATPSGYGYLNTTNRDVGGFELSGVYQVYERPAGGWVVTALLDFGWHDKIDPHGLQDKAGDALAWGLSLGWRSSYAIHIHWDSLTKMRFDAGGKLQETYGYPGDMDPLTAGPELDGFHYPSAYQR